MSAKKWSVLLLFIFGFFVLATRAQAQPTFLAQSTLPSTSVIPTGLPVPGFNCGNMEDVVNGTNKCCFNPVLYPKLVEWTSWPFSEVANWINNGLKDKLNPVLEMQKYVKVDPCTSGSPSIPGDLSNPACICISPTASPLSSIMPLCEKINPKSMSGGRSEKEACISCLSGNNTNQAAGIWTSVGCVYGNLGTFIQESVLGWGIGLAGGVSMLCIMYAAFMMQTSRGNAETIKKAQQLMTSCITGLMLIIFSVLILRVIGVSILKIPGFSF